MGLRVFLVPRIALVHGNHQGQWQSHINRPDTGPYLTKVKTLKLNLAKREPSTQDIRLFPITNLKFPAHGIKFPVKFLEKSMKNTVVPWGYTSEVSLFSHKIEKFPVNSLLIPCFSGN